LLLIAVYLYSILGPLDSIANTEDVTGIFKKHDLQYHMFADDKQLPPQRVSE